MHVRIACYKPIKYDETGAANPASICERERLGEHAYSDEDRDRVK